MTLGHIVASTKLNEDRQPLKNVVGIISEIQQNIAHDSSGKTLEEVWLKSVFSCITYLYIFREQSIQS